MAEGIIVNIPAPGKPKTYAIAYLDLLGTTSKISKDKNNVYLYTIRSIYDMAVKSSGKDGFSDLGFNRIETKIFSDNIVMAIPLDSGHEVADVCCLLKFVAIIQNHAAISSNWLVRGGVTIGELYIDNILIWGQGLIRAYELENHIAVFPRIIIDRNVLELLGADNLFFCRDIDGQFYLNFLEFMEYRDTTGADVFVPQIRRHFEQLLSEIKMPNGNYAERPYQKLHWHRNYINAWYRKKHQNTTILPIDESIMP